MSTRQLRVNDREQIIKRLKELSGKKINIVLNDSTVVLVTILRIDDASVETLNSRLKKIKIPLTDISEIYYDTKE